MLYFNLIVRLVDKSNKGVMLKLPGKLRGVNFLAPLLRIVLPLFLAVAIVASSVVPVFAAPETDTTTPGTSEEETDETDATTEESDSEEEE